MSGMNSWLASIYGTDGADDLEKTAQTHLLQKLAEEQNIDLNQFSEEELQALLQEVMGQQVMQQAGAAPQGLQPGQPGYDMNPTQAGFGQQFNAPGQNGQPSGQVHTPQGPRPQAQGQGVHPSVSQAFAPAAQPSAQGMSPGAMQQGGGADMAAMQKEAQAKFEEADLLGRVMAHAYTQELEKIAAAKTAAPYGDAEKTEHKRIARGAARIQGVASAGLGAAAAAKGGRSVKEKVLRGAAGAAAGGAIGYGSGYAGTRAVNRVSRAVGGKAKEASAFEKLAEMHAADILGAAGVDPATGQDQWAAQQAPEQTQQVQDQGQQFEGQQQVQEQGTPDEQFAAALDNRALEMLAAAGYDTNELVARIQYAQQQAQQGDQGQA